MATYLFKNLCDFKFIDNIANNFPRSESDWMSATNCSNITIYILILWMSHSFAAFHLKELSDW